MASGRKFGQKFFLLDYCEGGHDKVYPFIPKNEVWIEKLFHPKKENS